MAATKRGKGADKDGPPPFYIAAERLPVGTEMGNAVAGVAAFQPGDRVPAEHVERYGWQAHVRAPGDEPPPQEPQLQSQDAAQGPDTGAHSDIASLPLPAPPAPSTPQDDGKPPPDDQAADGAASTKEKP
jgi:hypothetical protein